MSTGTHDAEVERLQQQVSLLVRRSRSVLRVTARRIHPDVDAAAYTVLLALDRGEPVRMVDLAEEFGVDKSTMSRQVSTLLGLGLVARRPDPGDGRAFLLGLSADGARRLAEVSRARHEVWLAGMRSWSTEDIATLADGLVRLGAAIPVPDPPVPG